jgi:hypothetical protein
LEILIVGWAQYDIPSGRSIVLKALHCALSVVLRLKKKRMPDVFTVGEVLGTSP